MIDLKEEVWMFFNSEIFIISDSGDGSADVWGNTYLMDLMLNGHMLLEDILFISEYLGPL